MTFYLQCKKGNKLSFSTKPCNNHRKSLYFIYLELCTFLKVEALEKYEISGGGGGWRWGRVSKFLKRCTKFGKNVLTIFIYGLNFSFKMLF